MIVVVGAGISGLSAAWFLSQKGQRVRVLEGRKRVGGVIGTQRFDGYLIERGPNSTLRRPGGDDDALGRLVQHTGLSQRLISAAPAASKRYVMRDGRLLALPGSPPGFVTTELFSWRAKLRLLREPFIARAHAEETIAQFVERRLGREFLDYAVDPFVSGVYAGDPRQLSVSAAVPRVQALERDYGSLIRGAIAKGSRGAGPAGQLVSFDEGMATLPETIAARLPAGSIETGCQVTGLARTADGWRVRFETSQGRPEELTARQVVLAVPAAAAARLIAPLSSEAAGLLEAIPYAPIVSAGLGYARDRVRHPLDGFGFLVPRREGMRTLGGLFSSTLFSGRAPAGAVLVTAFIGGMRDAEVVTLDDAAIIERLGNDLAAALGIDGRPAMVRLTRHRNAIPQYTLGHLDRVARVETLLAHYPGLHLRASWRDGISVADCVRSGEVLAERLSGAAV